MKRDMNLVREILLSIEQHPLGHAPEIDLEGYTKEQIGYHAHIMIQAGLVKGHDTTNLASSGPEALITSLTWEGHEFLDAARNPGLWQQAKELVDKVGSAPIQIWVSVLTDLVKRSIFDS